MTRDRPDFACADCGVCTFENNDYYMVTNTLWAQYGAGRHMLCIPCLETRMGRRLVPTDFADVLLHHLPGLSATLKNRLGQTNPSP